MKMGLVLNSVQRSIEGSCFLFDVLMLSSSHSASLAAATVNSDITFFYYSKLKRVTCLPPTHFLRAM
jgi:hypothetical protein